MESHLWLMEILPFGYEYVIKEASKDNDAAMTATIRVNLFCEADAIQWMSQFTELSKLNFRVTKTVVPAEKKLLFKKTYCCHHNTRLRLDRSKTKLPSTKQTNCPAILRITVKNSKIKRSKDEHVKTHPCEIYLKNSHNHSLESPDELRYRKPNQSTVEKIKELYHQGYSPSAALKLLKCDLQEQYGSDYLKYASDGALCPTLQWMYRFYYHTFKKKCRESNIPNIKSVEYIENEQQITFEETLNDSLDIHDIPEEKNFPDNEVLDQNKENRSVDVHDIPENKNSAEKEILDQNKENRSVEERLGDVFDTLKNNLGNPEVFSAVMTFLDNFEKIETQQELATSLKMFGHVK